MKKQSKKFSLNWFDAIKGAIVATVTGGLTYLLQVLQTNDFTQINIQQLASISLCALVAYLIKNFFTPPSK